MADVLRLANEGQTSTYNLLTGNLKLRDNTWRTRTAPVQGGYRHTPFGAQSDFSHYGLVVEQMDLASSAGSSSIRQAANDIEEFLENARRWNKDSLNIDSQWLEWNVDGESVKRALLYEGSLSYPNYIGVGPMLPNDKALARVAMTRHPFWETYPHVDENFSGADFSCTGGKQILSAVPGKVPARIRSMQIDGTSSLAGVEIETLWLGWREKYGGVANFDASLECEDGTNDTDATDTVDGTASGSSKVQVDFSTETGLDRRMYITIHNHSISYYAQYRGRYRILCRCKSTAGSTTLGVQLRTGYSSAQGTWVLPQEEIFITNTNWQLKELGEFQIPPMGMAESMGAAAYPLLHSTMEVWAEQISGSGYLDLDCLILIPSDHFLYIDQAGISYSGSPINPVYVHTLANDTLIAYADYATTTKNNLDISVHDWYIPVGDVMLVVAGQRAASHDLSDAVDITIDYHPRWFSYREA
jgi:hypothetical protein